MLTKLLQVLNFRPMRQVVRPVYKVQNNLPLAVTHNQTRYKPLLDALYSPILAIFSSGGDK
jgi:hypothetical protein